MKVRPATAPKSSGAGQRYSSGAIEVDANRIKHGRFISNAVIIASMLKGPPDTHRHVRHARRTPIRQTLVSALLGVSWIGGMIAAFVIGFGLAGASEPAQPSVPGAQEPATGPALVGAGGLVLVFLAGAQISLLRDRRRHPKARYRALHGWRYRTIAQALRHNLWAIPIAAGFIAAGLWLTHLRG
jgi:hypothetical protein